MGTKVVSTEQARQGTDPSRGSCDHFRLDLEETASQRENSLLFPTKTCCLLQTKSNVCNLKKVFLSSKTCSNAALQLVDRLLLLCMTLSVVGGSK